MTVYDDYDLIKINISNDFKFIDIIKLIYSKCNHKLTLNEKQKILDYLNYIEEIPLNEEFNNNVVNDNDLNKFNYNMSKLNEHIDFSILGHNIIRNKKTKYYKKQKNTYNNNKNINSQKKINNEEQEDEDEFVDIEL